MQNEEINIDNENAVEPSFPVLDKWLKKKKKMILLCETWCVFKDVLEKESGSMEQFLNDYVSKALLHCLKQF